LLRALLAGDALLSLEEVVSILPEDDEEDRRGPGIRVEGVLLVQLHEGGVREGR
jgi:hypothetical protein